MRNFLFFFFGLGLAGVVYHFGWGILISPVNRHFVEQDSVGSEREPSVARLIWALFQLYVIAAWAAFCVGLVHRFALLPNVSHPWIYWLFGWAGCVAPATPIGPRDTKVPNYIGFFTAVAFVIFAIWPKAMLPWAWLIN